ncbi:glycosyltransferase family 2 protein [Pseudomonadota bacterium]
MINLANESGLKSKPLQLSIVIPTYRREQVLLNTLSALLNMKEQGDELIVVDQTEAHEKRTKKQLVEWERQGLVKVLVLRTPSITASMNFGMLSADADLVLFLDDDLVPHAGLVDGHRRAHQSDSSLWATVGQVIQPWQVAEPISPPRRRKGLETDFDFPFHSTIDADVENVMAGNLCVNRERALRIGGFDERFIGAAYRFETDFARRVINVGGKIRFIGSAGVDHLRAESGGTRSSGNHMTSASPEHGFGDYYYAFRHGRPGEAWVYSLKRVFREVRTRFHLTHPWWIPVKLVGEIRAILMARRIIRQGPKLPFG